jgi:hypothetical protein
MCSVLKQRIPAQFQTHLELPWKYIARAARMEDSSSFKGKEFDAPLKYRDTHELRFSISHDEFKSIKPAFNSISFFFMLFISILSLNRYNLNRIN